LSSKGQNQVNDLRNNIKSLKVDLIVCSPLSRAIQTCLGSFGSVGYREIIVSELCREKLENGCDIGRPISEIRKEYPNLDFSEMKNEIWWYIPKELRKEANTENYKEIFQKKRYQEPEDVLQERINLFKKWLSMRPEKTIAIVSHSTFLMTFMGAKEKMANCHVEQFNMDY